MLPKPSTSAPAPVESTHPRSVFSKIDRVPDLLRIGDATLSLYADGSRVLHVQAHLRDSGLLVLFPVTFRLVNRYLAGDFDLAGLVERAPCEELLLVTPSHNLLPVDKAAFDVDQLCYSRARYPGIDAGKVASVQEIRDALSACMRL